MTQNLSAVFNSYDSVGGFAKGLLSSMHIATLIPMATMIAPYSDTQKQGKGELGSAFSFVTKAMLYNAAASTAQSISGYVEALLAEALFIMGKFWYYKFLINPQNFSLSHSKLQSVEETTDLTIINTYRNASPTMTFSGISGSTLNRAFIELMDPNQIMFPSDLRGAMVRYPKLSTAYLKFRQLEKFYNETNSDVVIVYDMDIYVGKMSSFNFNMDANNPWVINYTMVFKLYPNMSLHTFSAYDYTPFFDEMTRRYGSTIASDFEGKAKGKKK
jgi:hypothetical protein